MTDVNEISVFIPTGYGSKGIDLAALSIAENIMKETSIDNLQKKYYKVRFIDIRGFEYNKWGFIIKGKFKNSKHIERILKDLNFNVLDNQNRPAVF